MTEFYEDGTPIDEAALGEFCPGRRGHRRRGFDGSRCRVHYPRGRRRRIRVDFGVTCQVAADTVAERPGRVALVKVNAAEAAILTGLDTSDADGAVGCRPSARRDRRGGGHPRAAGGGAGRRRRRARMGSIDETRSRIRSEAATHSWPGW